MRRPQKERGADPGLRINNVVPGTIFLNFTPEFATEFNAFITGNPFFK